MIVVTAMVMVMIVLVAVRVPPLLIFVPPTLTVLPAPLTSLLELVAGMVSLATVPSMMFGGLVQAMIGPRYTPLAVVVARSSGSNQAECPTKCTRKQDGFRKLIDSEQRHHHLSPSQPPLEVPFALVDAWFQIKEFFQNVGCVGALGLRSY